MKQAQVLAVLRRLVATPTAPYDEHEVRGVLQTIASEHGLHCQLDAHGNTFVRVRRGMPRGKIAFVAHLDHPVLRVVGSKRGELVCEPQGGFATTGLCGATLLFPRSSSGPVTGRVRKVSAAKRTSRVVVELAKDSATPAPGDFGVPKLPAFSQRANRLALLAADDLAGAAAVLVTLVELSQSEAACDVTGVFTRAEEVGFHGALGVALDGGLPRETVIVSVECSKAMGDIELGKGAVVRLGDKTGPFDPRATASLMGAARELVACGGRYQFALMGGGRCEATAFLAFGYRATGIALPLLCYHNQGPRGLAAEQIDARDLAGAIALMTACAARVGAGIDDLDLLRNDLVRSSEEGRQRLRAR